MELHIYNGVSHEKAEQAKSKNEAAHRGKHLKISLGTLSNWMKKGSIPFVRLGGACVSS